MVKELPKRLEEYHKKNMASIRRHAAIEELSTNSTRRSMKKPGVARPRRMS